MLFHLTPFSLNHTLFGFDLDSEKQSTSRKQLLDEAEMQKSNDCGKKHDELNLIQQTFTSRSYFLLRASFIQFMDPTLLSK